MYLLRYFRCKTLIATLVKILTPLCSKTKRNNSLQHIDQLFKTKYFSKVVQVRLCMLFKRKLFYNSVAVFLWLIANINNSKMHFWFLYSVLGLKSIRLKSLQIEIVKPCNLFSYLINSQNNLVGKFKFVIAYHITVFWLVSHSKLNLPLQTWFKKNDSTR